MGQVFSFLAGVLVGVAVGLLYAPMSGDELRAEIRSEAETQSKKAEAEINRRMKEFNESLEATRRELMAYVEGAQQKAEEVQPETPES